MSAAGTKCDDALLHDSHRRRGRLARQPRRAARPLPGIHASGNRYASESSGAARRPIARSLPLRRRPWRWGGASYDRTRSIVRLPRTNCPARRQAAGFARSRRCLPCSSVPLRGLVDAAGKRLRLTEKERAILLRLAKAGGASVSRDMLLRDVWGYNPAVTTRTLETHIYRLRRKLELDASTARLLVTERGGYKLASRGDLRPSRGRTSF
ncbi:MAG: winged helix-turn-helix domain-containing protein [Methylocystis sp.]|nr:winged helix-turn-helix domain-containing protein [Methylocystis sp.]